MTKLDPGYPTTAGGVRWISRHARRWAGRGVAATCSACGLAIDSLKHRSLRLTLRAACILGNAIALPALIRLARAATALRMRFGMPRSMWGVTPILTLPLLARCDRELGLGSMSLVFTTYHTSSQFDINLKKTSHWIVARHPHWYRPFTWLVFAYALLRFDFFHVFCDRGILLPPGRMGLNPREMDILAKAGKRLYTYTYGADVRTRNRTLALGRFNFCMDCPEPGKFCICDDATGEANIGAIEKYATAMLAMGDMTAYVPRCTNLHFWPLDMRTIEYVGVEPVRVRARPLRVAHAPNHNFFKGTSYLEDAIRRLQSEGYAIELVRVQGVPNKEVLQLFASADVVAEQFIGGFHGYTALEAMAAGKAVISYVRTGDLLIDGAACPIISATPDSLYQSLRDILAGKYDLEELGRRGRRYVERYYSIEAVAARLGHLYIVTANLPDRVKQVIEANVARLEKLLAGALGSPPEAPLLHKAANAGRNLA